MKFLHLHNSIKIVKWPCVHENLKRILKAIYHFGEDFFINIFHCTYFRYIYLYPTTTSDACLVNIIGNWLSFPMLFSWLVSFLAFQENEKPREKKTFLWTTYWTSSLFFMHVWTFPTWLILPYYNFGEYFLSLFLCLECGLV